MSGIRILPADAVEVTIDFDDAISIAWPSWDKSDAWDVWDGSRVRHGAHRVETVTRMSDAVESARALVRERAKGKRTKGGRG